MGIGESIKGTAKEKVGDLIGDDHLKAEGDAQETKGEAQTEETEARVEAQGHEKKADALQAEQDELES